MNLQGRAWWLAAALLGCSGQAAPDSDSLAEPTVSDTAPVLGGREVRVAEGALNGRLLPSDVRAYLGIPYAEAPVAELRWRSPRPVARWSGAREAGAFGPRCPQSANHGATDAAESEDCLYLNVWTPNGAAAAPVMVWIHGGGNRDGTASYEGTSGEWLSARLGVVVVSLNYRLGVLGFLAHSALAAEGSKSGNQGLWDQQLALTWIQRNIAAFDGDPDNVTIFGESAGAADVCLHLAAPASRGLFQRAISESGSCTTRRLTAADAEAFASALASQVGCSDTNMLTCLRAAPLPDIFAATERVTAQGSVFGPVVDGDFTPEQPRALFDRGAIAHVPFLVGTNTDEGTAFTMDQTGIVDQAQYLALIAQRLTGDPQQIADHYPVSAFAGAKNPYQAAFARAWGDGRLVCSSYDGAARAAAAGLPVFMYNFDVPIDGNDGVWGAAHAAEIVYVFGTTLDFTPQTAAVSDMMQRYWTQFAKSGDPNTPVLPAWPRWSERENVRMNFAVQPGLVSDFRASECAFWRAQYELAFTKI